MKNNTVNELYHHGIKGMKWGIRRTPEQLGYKVSTVKRKSKTEKERKAAAKEAIKKAMAKKKSDLKIAEMKRKGQEKIDRMAAKEIAKQQKKIDKKNAKIYRKQQNKINEQQQKELKRKEKRLNDPMAHLTNDELREKYERLMLEKNVYDINNQLQKHKPQKKEALVKRFAKSAVNDVVIPGAKVAGQQLFREWMYKVGKEKLGLNATKNSYDDLKQQIANLKLVQEKYKLDDYFSSRADQQKKKNEKKVAEARQEAIKNAKNRAKNNPYSKVRMNETFNESNPSNSYNVTYYSNNTEIGKKVWDSKYSQHVYEVPYREVDDKYSIYGRTVTNRLLLN